MPRRLSLSAFKAVFFDIDGTLVDSLAMLIRGLGDTYERYTGVRPSDEDIQALIGLPLRKQLALFRDEPLSEAQYQEMYVYTLERFDANQHLEIVFSEAVEALRLCNRAGIKTALVTSKSDLELASFIYRFTGTQHVDTTVCASDVSHPKPHPESALLACERLHVPPGDAVLIGDSAFDIRCGRDAGLRTIAVAYGAAARQSLLAEEPDMVLDTPSELLEWVQESLLDPTCQERK
jgi:pyrophosphatase PpaX